MNRFLFIFILTSCHVISTIAQTTINGYISNSAGTPLVGANIYLQGTYDGASTDSTGKYSFTTYHTDTTTLVASYLGFQTYRVPMTPNGQTMVQDVVMKSNERTIDAVVISAGAFEASDEKKGVILRPLDIVTTAGANADIASALNTLPGTQTVGEEGQLFVRGGAAYETTTFIDGMRVQSPYGSRVPDVPARGRFSPFLFKGTLFSTGGYSAEYGQALSSALILETQDLPDETVTGISLMTVGGELAHTQRWDKTSLAVSGGYSNLGPYFELIPQNLDWKKAPQGYNGSAGFRHKTSQTGLLKAFASFSHSDMHIQFPRIGAPTIQDEFRNQNDNYFFNGTWKELLGNTWLMRAGVSYSNNGEAIQFQGGKVDVLEQSGQGKLTFSRPLGNRINLLIGGTAWKSRFDERYTPINENAIEGSTIQTLLDENFVAGFTEISWSLTDKLALRLGGRAEYSSLLSKGNLAPRLSMAYKTGVFSQVSMAYGQFHQSPENTLMRVTQSFSFEKATHYILNYQWMKDQRTLRVEGYYKTYDQLAKYDPNREFDPMAYTNSGNGYARGIDFFWRDQKTFRFTDYWVSYSFLDTERDYRNFPVPATPRFASKHNFSLVTKRFIKEIDTQVGFTYSYASPRPYNDLNESGFNAGRTPAYHDLSFNASYLTRISGHFTILYVSATNLLGSEQIFGYRFSDQPDLNGVFSSQAIRPPAKRFFFIGLFISIGRKDQ